MHLQKQFKRPNHSTDGHRLRPACRLFKLAQSNLEPFLPVYLDLDVHSALDLCSKNIRAIEGAQFKNNPWSPAAAPVLALGVVGSLLWKTARFLENDSKRQDEDSKAEEESEP